MSKAKRRGKRQPKLAANERRWQKLAAGRWPHTDRLSLFDSGKVQDPSRLSASEAIEVLEAKGYLPWVGDYLRSCLSWLEKFSRGEKCSLSSAFVENHWMVDMAFYLGKQLGGALAAFTAPEKGGRPSHPLVPILRKKVVELGPKTKTASIVAAALDELEKTNGKLKTGERERLQAQYVRKFRAVMDAH